ncbi:MAG: tetratricopeptide repeat protein [Myxococcota bacterium]
MRRLRRGLALVLALGFALPAPAQQAEEPVVELTETERKWAARAGAIPPEEIARIDAERAVRRRLKEQAVRPRIGRYLKAAGEAMDEESPAAARALLAKLNVNRMNAHEKARIFRLEAYIAYLDGDPKGAIDAFQRVLAQEILAPKDEVGIRFSIAQLYGGLQDWDNTIKAVDEWSRWATEPNPMGYYLKAIAYFQKEDTELAIENAEAAVDLIEEPKESWLQLLAALYIGKEDYDSATPVLEELVLRFPKKIYWVQLSLIYGARDRYPRSLAVQQVAYAQGLLTEDKELRRLARSYVFADLPYPAAKVIEKGIADGIIEADQEAFELLANSWIASREYDRSLPPLQRAAELSEDGNLFVRLGQVHLQREEWDLAAANLRKGLERGSLDAPGTALLLLGISTYNDGRPGEARSFFNRARQHEKSKKAAAGWITHLDNEARAAAGAAAAEAEATENPT